jgi:hypothetical protein
LKNENPTLEVYWDFAQEIQLQKAKEKEEKKELKNSSF